MSVITISREFGSGGDAIAQELSRISGYPLVDKNILEKIYYQFGFTDFAEVYDENGIWLRFTSHHVEMSHLLKRIFRALVEVDNIVLLGRGGYASLKGYPNVLNVRIQSPFNKRVQNYLKSVENSNLKAAEEIVKQADLRRKEFVSLINGGSWDSSSSFDLVIDTGKISNSLAIDWIVQASNLLSKTVEPPESLESEDPVMLKAIQDTLAGVF
jgi:cytidylate kinase